VANWKYDSLAPSSPVAFVALGRQFLFSFKRFVAVWKYTQKNGSICASEEAKGLNLLSG